MAQQHHTFWAKYPGLAWSNPGAGDTVRIRAALLRPRFGRLLDIALIFGLERLQEEWRILLEEPTEEVTRAQESVERILDHIAKGFACADA